LLIKIDGDDDNLNSISSAVVLQSNNFASVFDPSVTLTQFCALLKTVILQSKRNTSIARTWPVNQHELAMAHAKLWGARL